MKVKEKLNKLLISMIFTFISVLCLITVTFAWMTVKNPVTSNSLLGQTSDKSVSVSVYVLKNTKIDSSTVLTPQNLYTTTEQLNTLLQNTKPNDFYSFKVVVTNNSVSSENLITLTLSNIELLSADSSNQDSIFDYFYIENVFSSIDEQNITYPQTNSQYESNVTKTIPSSTFTSLIDDNGNINLFSKVPSNSVVTFYFTLSLHFSCQIQNQNIKLGNITILSE